MGTAAREGQTHGREWGEGFQSEILEEIKETEERELLSSSQENPADFLVGEEGFMRIKAESP